MDQEFRSLIKNETWELADLPAGRSPVTVKWVFKIKTKSDGTVDRYKARCCARGFSQRKGIDYQETYSPVVRYESVRILLAVVAFNDLDMIQFDIKTAFLHGQLAEEIYMSQPEGYDDGSGRVCRLKKGIYGLKQAPRQWNAKFNDFLVRHGFNQSDADDCMYISQLNGKVIILAIYFDDGLLCGEDQETLFRLLKEMNESFELRHMEPDVFIGMEIVRDRDKRTISISQGAYIRKVLKRFGMEDSKPVKTPGDSKSKLSLVDDSPLAEWFPYREAIGSLQYAVTCTRPDIAFEVSSLARFNSAPRETHVSSLKRIMRYLNGTADATITYGGGNMQLETYCDAGYITDTADPRASAGRIHLLNGGAIDWSSHRMDTVPQSTCEAEYMAIAEAVKDVLWIRTLLSGLFRSLNQPVIVWNDNQSAVDLVKNGAFHSRTRHIAARYHFTRNEQKSGTIDVRHISTDLQLADFLT